MALSQAEWHQRLPELVRACADGWKLRVGAPYPAGADGVVYRVERADGTPAVLKLALPHRESAQEADALECWDGDGAVRLLAHDDERSAMLLERLEPGTRLSEAHAADPMAVFAALLPRLWIPVGAPFRALADEAAWWVSYLPRHWEEFGRPFERRLLDAALELLSELPGSQGEAVLVNQDLQGENVLAAHRGPWLVIDPKPLRGEREFSLAPIVRGSEFGHTRPAVVGRLDRLSADLGLDRERARGWTIAQTIAWCFDPQCLQDHTETARWLLDA